MLPALRPFPALADRVLAASGRLCWAFPHRRRRLARQLAAAAAALELPPPDSSVRSNLAANIARFTARDYLLDRSDDQELSHQFDITGQEHVINALREGRGVLLLGSHCGAHVAGIHWLTRQDWPLRMLIQRPKHVSRRVDEAFDRDAGDPFAQSEFFLRRGLPPIECTRRVLRVHEALRRGMAVYLSGDVPWVSRNARPARLLRREQTFLSVWADLAALAGAPVVPMFCAHRPGGGHRLTFDAAWNVRPGEEGEAVQRYIDRLEQVIRDDPADAVAHVTWPCYGAPSDPKFNAAAIATGIAGTLSRRGTLTERNWA
jgi:lauroyl/myristoyl acyltransferase